MDLMFVEKWLEKRLKIFLNPIANITVTQGTKTVNQHQKNDKERKQINSFHNSTLQSPDKTKKNENIFLLPMLPRPQNTGLC